MYADFTGKLLPAIQSGLTITKDYAFDLMGRYVTYLLVVETIYLIMWLIIMALIIYLAKKLKNAVSTLKDTDEPGKIVFMYVISAFFCLTFLLAWPRMITDFVENHVTRITKLIIVPELIVAKDIQSFTSSK